MGSGFGIAAGLKRKWLRFAAADARYSGDRAKFERIYVVRNPWRLDSETEEFRLRETNRIIRDVFGGAKSLLEIGCGEGYQSVYLRQVCQNLIGIDVSARAVKRARKRCLGASFFVGDMFNTQVVDQAPFDVVVACEVLYYMSDIAGALRQMYELGRGIVVTYFAGEMERLDSAILGRFACRSQILESGNGRWRAVWFRGRHPVD